MCRAQSNSKDFHAPEKQERIFDHIDAFGLLGYPQVGEAPILDITLLEWPGPAWAPSTVAGVVAPSSHKPYDP